MEHVVAFEAEARHVLEEQREQRHEVLGLEQVHVERVLEVGGRVRRDHERGAVGAQHARELGDVQRRVHEVLDDVRRHDVVDAARRAGRARRRRIAHEARARRVGVRARSRPARIGLAAVVGADDEPVGRGEARGLVADAAADVDDDARAEAGDDLPVAGVVEREQRVGGRALHRALAGELHRVLPAPSPGLRAIERTADRRRRARVASPPPRTSDPASRLPRRPRCPTGAAEAHFRDRSRPRPARGPDDSGGRPDVIAKLGDIAATAGLRRIAILAWRDLDDPEAGGSELHASRVAALWAEAGIEVTMRTSYAAGHPQVSWRDGYRVIRKAGRYLVFPRAAFSEMMGWHGASDGAGRDLERHAVLLAAVGAPARRSRGCTTCTTRCGR